jgi:hypothetical protein
MDVSTKWGTFMINSTYKHAHVQVSAARFNDCVLDAMV